MTTIINGKEISEKILIGIKKEVMSLPFQPVFCDVLVGEDPASVQYVNMKRKKAEELGICFHSAFFSSDITTENLIKEIKILNQIQNICGIIVQLPLPSNIDQEAVLNAVEPKLDVDCLNSISSEKFYKGDFSLGFPTALACMALLDSLNLDLKNKKIVILGQGKLVGQPVVMLLNSRKLNIEIIRSQTQQKEKIIKEADVIISGMGQARYIKGSMLKNGVVVIDAGTSELNKSNSSVVGDVDLESVRGVASFLSPVPGGVGPMTIAMLFSNVLKVAKDR